VDSTRSVAPCHGLGAIMAYIETPDGVPLYYEDYGDGKGFCSFMPGP
jgi:hypothetical protein